MNLKMNSMKIISLWFLALIFWFSRTNAEIQNFDTYMANINGKLAVNLSEWNVKNIIKNYCDVVLQDNVLVENDMIHSARQSAWVYFVCHEVNWNFDSNITKYFKNLGWKDLGIVDNYTSSDQVWEAIDLCRASSRNDCQIQKHFPRILNQILNDYVNIKQSTIYGAVISWDTDQIIQSQANLFSSKYFNWLEICNENNPRKYPETCRTLVKYIRNVKKILNDVELLNVGEIQNDSDNGIVHQGCYK